MKCLSKIGNDLSDYGNCLSDFGNNPHMQIARRISDTGVCELGEWEGSWRCWGSKTIEILYKVWYITSPAWDASRTEPLWKAFPFRPWVSPFLTQLILPRLVARFLVTFNPHQGEKHRKRTTFSWGRSHRYFPCHTFREGFNDRQTQSRTSRRPRSIFVAAIETLKNSAS